MSEVMVASEENVTIAESVVAEAFPVLNSAIVVMAEDTNRNCQSCFMGISRV